MTRNNADFQEGRFTVPYEGQDLFHGTRQVLSVGDHIGIAPAEPHKGVNIPVAWTTTHPVDAAHYGSYDAGDGAVNVYTVVPVNNDSVRGIQSGVMRPGVRGAVHHFVSKHGFVVTGVHND